MDGAGAGALAVGKPKPLDLVPVTGPGVWFDGARAPFPIVVARPRDAQRLAHHAHGIVGLLRPHQGESLLYCWFAAKKVAAFFRNSFSSLSRSTSLRSARISPALSRSGSVSCLACTHLPSVLWGMPMSSAHSRCVLPLCR